MVKKSKSQLDTYQGKVYEEATEVLSRFIKKKEKKEKPRDASPTRKGSAPHSPEGPAAVE